MSGPGSGRPGGDDSADSSNDESICSSDDHSTESSTDDFASASDDESTDSAVNPADSGDREGPNPSTHGPSDSSTGRTDRTDRTDSPEPSPPSTHHSQSDREPVTIQSHGVLRWFLKTDDGTVVAIRDVLSSVAIVAVIGLILFGISGIWPPLVAVESGSMEPNMQRGDLIFVADNERFVSDGAIDGTGVVTAEGPEKSGHTTFGQSGDVIIFRPNGNDHATPVIHRAHLWVEEGDDWVAKADPDVVGDLECDDVESTCPARHDGFITKGDANPNYDQHRGGAQTDVVKPEWVTAKGVFRIPWLGHVRLAFDSIFSSVMPLPLEGSTSAVGAYEPGVVNDGSSDLLEYLEEPIWSRTAQPLVLAIVGFTAIVGVRRFQ